MTLLHLANADEVTSGGKAAPLGDLIRAGFNVPPGFVVPTTTYHTVTTALGLTRDTNEDTERTQRRILGSHLPDQVVRDLSHALQDLTRGAATDYVAVRSSSTAEDSGLSSAAGQHDSFLSVRGIEQVCQAIVRCWASLWNERAAAYQAHQPPTGAGSVPARMAVLVQRLVDARVSGIMFTGDTTMIEASYGLGERIVAGHVSPDSWCTNVDGIIQRRVGTKTERTDRHRGRLTTRPTTLSEQAQPCLTGDEVLRLHALGQHISSTLGGPRDIEWALADDTIWILQARPVTAAVPHPATQSVATVDEGAVYGVPASPGLASGPVRLIRGPSDFVNVRPGDVLVCHHTDPAWTPLFTLASAVVTENGGALSHAAIVAREVGIPAVLSVDRATKILTPSSVITVDGDTGRITLP